MHDYYWRDAEENEVIIQAASGWVSIRVSEEDDTTALALLPVEEIDKIIAGLQVVKQKITSRKGGQGGDLQDPT